MTNEYLIYLVMVLVAFLPTILEHVMTFFGDWEGRDYPDDISGGNI